MPFKDRQHTFVQSPVTDALPTAAQARGNALHVRLANGKYVSVRLRVPGDSAGRAALFEAIKAQPTEPSYSGTGRLYYRLAVGHAIRGKVEGLSLVPIQAGEDGPLAGYVMVDQALVPETAPEPGALTPALPPVPPDADVAPAPASVDTDEGDGDEGDGDEEGEGE